MDVDLLESELGLDGLAEHVDEALARGVTRAEHAHDLASAKIAASQGMEGSLRLLMEARFAGLSQSLALGLRSQESGIKGDGNRWGHDPTIFVGGYDRKHDHHYGDEVTHTAYIEYKRQRGPAGHGGMQGVGPLQLTYFSFQDRADKLGGCWVPRHNYQVGFEDLAHLIAVHRGASNPERIALGVYNSGAVHPNLIYADSVLHHKAHWHALLT